MAITSLCPGDLAQCCEKRTRHSAMALGGSRGVMTAAPTFSDDLAFLRSHTEVIVLSDADNQARVAIVPAWQGRVMTSTVGADPGPSFGWVNRELIASGKVLPHINAFGGEDRIWLGPEGGQYSIFFPHGAPFDFAYWQVPACLDTHPFQVVSHSSDRAQFESNITLSNYSGTRFDVLINREVRLLERASAWRELSMPSSEHIALIGYESRNVLRNVGPTAWRKETGLLSIWIMGMFPPGQAATIVVPIKQGAESELGPSVTSDYFGAVPAQRLKVTESAVFFSGDGRFRSKLGINARRSLGKLGSFDAARNVLTLVQFTQPENSTDYVNSRWMIQDDPYAGDALNAYNDGPANPGEKTMGPFFELESSSPAAALHPGGQIDHIHRTFHLIGAQSALDTVSRKVLGVSLDEVKSALLPHGHDPH
jgi:hypothetical protein